MNTTGPHKAIDGRKNQISFIEVAVQYMKDFAEGKYEFADVVRTMYHEFVFNVNKANFELEFEATYTSIINKNLPAYQKAVNQNNENGWQPIRTYLLKGSNNDPAVIEKYRAQISYILKNAVTPAAAASIKKTIEDRTGVKF